MFGLPGGGVLDFMDASRVERIEFLLVRHEATASLMADVTGQMQRSPAVCVSTLGPGAVNMTLGVANAYLDRSPLIAITATLARARVPVATHQDLDLNAVYRPFTKMALTLDGEDTEAKVRAAIAATIAPRFGPVHIALPSDIARAEEKEKRKKEEKEENEHANPQQAPPVTATPSDAAMGAMKAALSTARRPIVILGLDLDPRVDPPAVRAFVEQLQAPVFVTPKAKGLLPEDHPLFYGVCAGVSGDAVVVDFLGRGDLLIGVGFEPVESDKVWHSTMPLVAIGPVSIAMPGFQPIVEVVGSVPDILSGLAREFGLMDWPPDTRARFRADLEAAIAPAVRPRGLAGVELTRRLRDLFPRNTILATDVGTVKMITTQAWACYEPQTFFESNGLSTMSYAFPAAMAARLQHPDRPVLCTIGDGGFSMTIAELETCVRERIHFVTVVFNDSSLSLIDSAQQRRGYPTTGVRYGAVDFATASAGFGAWSRRVETLDELDAAVREAQRVGRPAVIDAIVDPASYGIVRRPGL